ncbi:hypothetical protein UT300005_05760 [Clostridium sp. CTA-5]
MKLSYKDNDFYISTKGLEFLKKLMYANIVIIVLIALFLSKHASDTTYVGESAFPQIITIFMIAFALAVPSIIVCLLITMIIDWTYNVEQQSKIQYNISNNTEEMKSILNNILELKKIETNNENEKKNL